MPDDAYAMPEFTRALRGIAAAGALGRPEHTSVFGPLLAARKVAEEARTVRMRVAAFDAARIERTWIESIAAIAAARVPKPGADRRALNARLTEQAAAVFDAIRLLARSAERVRLAGDAPDQVQWGAWIGAVQALFDGADRFWTEIEPELGPRPAPPRGKSGGAAARALFVAILGGSVLAPRAQAQHVMVSVPGVPAESLLAHGFDVAGSQRGASIVVADSLQLARMEARGWHGTPIRTPVARRTVMSARRGAQPQAIAATTVYRDYDDPARGIRFFLDSMAQNNPLVSEDTLGKSYEGRPMIAVKIGAKDDSPQRPNVLFIATYHPREWAATDLALRLIKFLAAPPGANPRVDSLVQARDIWILPVANPDGYEYTFTTDRLWRKTRSPQGGRVFGVDMNRNHRQNWGVDNIGSSPDPTSDVYRGPAPESEIEVRNIEAFHAAHPPVASVSYHSYGGVVLWAPSAFNGPLPADLPLYRTLAGTNLRSAVRDNLPGSSRSYDSPNTSWTLYLTNGEYNDWASARYGTLSFTTELTSGYTGGTFYGFEFPDDETQLQQLFADNLPFALDVIESARDPFDYASPTTFLHNDRIVLESVSPVVEATVPAATASSAAIAAPNPLSFRIDSANGGKYTRRLVTTTHMRPTGLTISAGGQTAAYNVLGINGAEPGDAGWTATQFTRDSTFFEAGKYSWYTAAGGELKSPVIAVPATTDTVSLMFWTRYAGNGYTELPNGDVSVSVDGGTTFQRVLRVQGAAPVFYPEQVTIGGVKGKQLVVDFLSNGLPWNLDEIAVVGHGAVTTTLTSTATRLVPSENPVHHAIVYFPWPFGSATGDILAYDFSGRLIWKTSVTTGGNVPWDLNTGRVANGVYVVIARSGGKTLRLKLFVVRDGS
ncbi:MAG: M14 family zinc carboxypeptidase [Gemmatimonadaceae bacterium]